MAMLLTLLLAVSNVNPILDSLAPALPPAFGLTVADETPAKPDKSADDLKLMQGKWTGNSPEGMETSWEIKDRDLKVEIGDIMFAAKLELDAEAKPHASIDFKLTKPADHEGKSVLGIYKVEKDKLVVCVAMPDNPDRPTVFQATEGETFLYELKRPKK